MDTTNEQRQVATSIEELESQLNRLSPRLAQLIEELTDVHGQVRSAPSELEDLRDARPTRLRHRCSTAAAAHSALRGVGPRGRPTEVVPEDHSRLFVIDF